MPSTRMSRAINFVCMWTWVFVCSSGVIRGVRCDTSIPGIVGRTLDASIEIQ